MKTIIFEMMCLDYKAEWLKCQGEYKTALIGTMRDGGNVSLSFFRHIF